MINRRTFMQATAAGAGLSLLPFSYGEDLRSKLQASDLVYITTIKSNGKESSCQAEIWYVWDGADIYVITASTSWRATSPSLGLDRSRIWVGDVGNWKQSNGQYKKLPTVEAVASVLPEESAHEKALELFGDKYSMEWVVWGPRFRDGLADGSRSLLRYRPLTV